MIVTGVTSIFDRNHQQVRVACATCGEKFPMPFEGPIPESGTKAWWILVGMGRDYSMRLGDECQYAQTLHHEGWPWD